MCTFTGYYMHIRAMSERTEIQRMRELEDIVEYHSRKYYVDNAPEISDFEFDALLRELQELEAKHPDEANPNSPTKRVGSDITNSFKSVEHRYPMLSLANTYSSEELGEWIYTNSPIINTWGSPEPRRQAWNWNVIAHGALGLMALALGDHEDWLALAIERMIAVK